MRRPVAVRSPHMPNHLIDADNIIRADWNGFCRPAVRLQFGNGNFDMITRDSALVLVRIGAIPAP